MQLRSLFRKLPIIALTLVIACETASDNSITDSSQSSPNSRRPPPEPLTLAVNPLSRRAAVTQSAAAPGDNAAISLTGDNANTARWTASKRKPWITLLTSSGKGSGSVTWNRNATGLVVGIYVDTITVTVAGAVGSPARVVDTLEVTPVAVPLALALSPRHISTTITAGANAPSAVASVTLTGDNSVNALWSAAKKKSWTMLTVASGLGSGSMSWDRVTAALAAGTYVDTITVTAAGALNSPLTLIDTVVVNSAPVSGGPDLGLLADFHGRAFFPPSDPWNQPVDTAQVDPSSALILGTIGLGTSLHPDWGAGKYWTGSPFGFPYIVVPDATARVPVAFDIPDESDPGPYPIPPNPPIEGGAAGDGDRHLLVVTQNEWKLFELFYLYPSGSNWTAYSGAIFDLTTGAPRPAGWTSSDAAGLPILPGLVRYDEVYGRGEITHALRFTVVHSRRAYVPPASHYASSSTSSAYAPMGMRVRLKASFDISGYPPAAQVILRALKKYGMMVADNGGNFFVSGTADARWDDDVLETLKQVHVGDFEVVKMVGVVGG